MLRPPHLTGATKIAKPGSGPTAPLEGYFDKGIWARARDFAQKDAVADAGAILRGKDKANETLRWTAVRSKRDRTLEKFRCSRHIWACLTCARCDAVAHQPCCVGTLFLVLRCTHAGTLRRRHRKC